jgi:ubiquinone/menaquinone biosynthesis C-methylase UbiE
MDNEHNRKIVEQFSRWAKPFADLPLHSEADSMARTLAACTPREDSAILDVACGPGILACALAEKAGRVTGIDMTPAMIEQARLRQAAQGLDNVEWRIGDAVALPFGDESFDRVVTRYSFHHMLDPFRVLAEMVRVCRAGGRIVVIDATPKVATQAAYDRMEKLRDPSHASALTLAELMAMGGRAGLKHSLVDSYGLAAHLDPLADACNLPALNAMFDADIESGTDSIGVGAWRAPDGVRFKFPISIVAWDV